MKILFIHPPWAEVYGNYREASRIGNAYPPLGLCCLASVVEANGHSARIIDAEFEDKAISDLINDVRDYRPHLIGITAATSIAHIAEKLSQAIKEVFPDIPVLLGGPHCTALLEQCMRSMKSVDYGMYGEAERSIIPFLNYLQGNIGSHEVPGLLFRGENGAIFRNPPAPLETCLERLPFPDRSKLKLDKYRWSVPGKGIVKFTTIMTSRGCPFKCIFCSAATVFGRKVRKRPVPNVIDEIEHCVTDHGIRHFSFIDDTLTLDRERVEALCDGIIERCLDITWEGWTRADTVDYDLLSIMHTAGFTRISFGIETGNAHISKRIKKGVSLDAYGPAYTAAKKAGIETRGSIILGLPGETRKTAWETIRFACKLKGCDQLYINIATPYPGTELYDIAQRGDCGMHLLTDDFSEYRRYGNAVVEVNDLSSSQLVRLQRLGFLMFYLRPDRIYYNYKRAGFRAFVKNATAFAKSVILG